MSTFDICKGPTEYAVHRFTQESPTRSVTQVCICVCVGLDKFNQAQTTHEPHATEPGFRNGVRVLLQHSEASIWTFTAVIKVYV